MKKKIDIRIVMLSIVCLSLIEIVAMLMGINGTLRTIIVSAICLLAGLSIDTSKLLKK